MPNHPNRQRPVLDYLGKPLAVGDDIVWAAPGPSLRSAVIVKIMPGHWENIQARYKENPDDFPPILVNSGLCLAVRG